MTIKLYWSDSHLTRFTARVTDTWLHQGGRVVVLDQTAFYPAGGGQPCDMGFIGAAQVIDVEMEEDARILHRFIGEADLKVGEEVDCQVDLARRREMIQQHTGQHILSQAFFRLSGAETRGFRITGGAAEIDLTLEGHEEDIERAILRAEELANTIVFDNREVRIHELTPEEAAGLPLRKESFIADCVRVIEIDDYDWSPCGGTHAKRTGEVGLIAVKRWERAKRMVRVHFVCGGRALADYRSANQISESIARKFSVGREETELAVARLFEEHKHLSRRVRELVETASTVEARGLIDSSDQIDGFRIVSKVFESRDFEELKLLAHRLVEGEGVVALLASRESDMARIVFAGSPDVSADMNSLIRTACEKLGGRGGGKTDFAQGGGPKVDQLEAALDEAIANLKRDVYTANRKSFSNG